MGFHRFSDTGSLDPNHFFHALNSHWFRGGFTYTIWCSGVPYCCLNPNSQTFLCIAGEEWALHLVLEDWQAIYEETAERRTRRDEPVANWPNIFATATAAFRVIFLGGFVKRYQAWGWTL